MTLVILAAGMGSRYGGLKQIDPITPSGEFIIDFSVFDAIRAGFQRVVFVIKEENLEIFRETIGKRIEPFIKVSYVFQKNSDLPEGFVCPAGRVKPFGTAHALLSARKVLDDPFAVINSDDFYGREAFEVLASHLKTAGAGEYCMVGYRLRNTLTENGSVSRGVCATNGAGFLEQVTERTQIVPDGDRALYTEDGKSYPLPLDTVVSMNCWGFTPDLIPFVEEGFRAFLADPAGDPLKKEYYLPFAVQSMVDSGKCRVRVYETDAKWFGVTYPGDKERVKEGIGTLIRDRVYPGKLFVTPSENKG